MAAQGLTGMVRRYNGSKGFGFIVGPGEFNDVLFSRNELPEDAREVRGQIIENRTVSFDAMIQPDGRAKATSVLMLYEEGLKCPGQVTQWVPGQGIGTVSSSCLTEEVNFSTADFQPRQSFSPGANLLGALVLFEAATLPDGTLKASKIQFQTAKIAEQYTLGPVSGRSSSAASVVTSANEPTEIETAAALQSLLRLLGSGGGLGLGALGGGLGALGGGVGLGALGATQAVKRPALSLPTVVPPLKTARTDLGLGLGLGLGALGAVKTSGPVAVTPTGKMMAGTIKSYSVMKGWGLISSPGIPSGGSGQDGDVFFMKSNLPQAVRDTEGLQGSSVTYELVTTQEGKFRAQNITIAA